MKIVNLISVYELRRFMRVSYDFHNFLAHLRPSPPTIVGVVQVVTNIKLSYNKTLKLIIFCIRANFIQTPSANTFNPDN